MRSYEAVMRLRVLDDLRAVRLSDLRRPDVQDFADRMVAAGHDASTIKNPITPLQVLYRRALGRGEVAVDPTAALQLPGGGGSRDRIASPAEAAALIAALASEHDRAAWAVAFYAGLRLGEIQALRHEDVDLGAG